MCSYSTAITNIFNVENGYLLFVDSDILGCSELP